MKSVQFFVDCILISQRSQDSVNLDCLFLINWGPFEIIESGSWIVEGFCIYPSVVISYYPVAKDGSMQDSSSVWVLSGPSEVRVVENYRDFVHICIPSRYICSSDRSRASFKLGPCL